MTIHHDHHATSTHDRGTDQIERAATDRPTAEGLDHDRSPRRPRWPLVAILAGVSGLAAGFTSLGQGVAQEDPDPYLLVESLDRARYHTSFLLGLVTFAALLVLVTALRRWADERAGGHLAAHTMATGLSVTATVGLIATCMAGALALYLPGGADDGTMWTEGLLFYYLYLDFGMLIGWWGAMVAATASVVLAFSPSRILPRWFGVISAVLVALPLLPALFTGLPGLPGMFMPLWLLVLGATLSLRRSELPSGVASSCQVHDKSRRVE